MAKMRLMYLTYDGQAKMEKTRALQTRQIEMPDGVHSYTNNSVWQDAKRLREPIIIISQGLHAPLGATNAREDALQELYEIKLASKALRNPSVSKMLTRKIERAIDWVTTNGIVVFVLGGLGIYMLMTFTGA